MEFIYTVSFIISLILLVQYFILCSNVRKIKNALERPSAATNIHLIEYKKYKFWGEKEKAIVKLKDSFWYELNLLKGMNNGAEENLKRYADLKLKYETAFQDYNIIAPEWSGKF